MALICDKVGIALAVQLLDLLKIHVLPFVIGYDFSVGFLGIACVSDDFAIDVLCVSGALALVLTGGACL